MPAELAVIVPTRGRPENIDKVIAAWDFTNAWDVADLVLAVDADDPKYPGYRELFEGTRNPDTREPLFSMHVSEVWTPMVHKLNRAAVAVAESRKYSAVGFAGDDHLPRTINWAERYLTVLRELGTGMVHGDDGYQGENLATEWAVTSDVVRVLGGMVLAPVEHMYCDNSMVDLFGGAGALRYLPEVRIEHMHPIAGKAATDDQYKRVNSREQFHKDRLAYQRWQVRDLPGLILTLRAMRPGKPAVRRDMSTRRRTTTVSNMTLPRHFKRVTGATPLDIELSLADFAYQVPKDQEIVEIGVYQGRTALVMAWGAKQGQGAHVTAIDAWDLPGNTYAPPFTDVGSKNWARYNVKALGFSNGITLVQAFSHEHALAYEGPDVGLLFIDGDHSKEGARRDVETWALHLAEGAVIAVDDYEHPDWPGVKEALDELTDEGFIEPVRVLHERLAVTRLTGRAPQPPAAITSEGVSPSPEPPNRAALEAEWERVDPDGVAALRESAARMVDTEPSREKVRAGELEGVEPGTSIEALNTYQLRALARARDIVLGPRKDKRSEMLEALRAGQ